MNSPLAGIPGIGGRRGKVGDAAMFARWGGIAAWPLNEASGQAVDAYTGGRHLSAVNSPGTAAGKVGTARSFSGVAQAFSRASEAALQIANVDAWGSGWFYFTSLAARQACVSKDGNASREYMLEMSAAAQRFRYTQFCGGGAIEVTATTPVLATGTWYHALWWHDAVNDTANIQVDGGTVYSTSTAGAVPDTGATAFMVGDRAFSGAELPMSGRADALYMGKSPTGGVAGVIAEIGSTLYNAGAGKELIL